MSARAITTSLGTGSAFALALRLIDRLEPQVGSLGALPDPALFCAPLLREQRHWDLESVLLGVVLGALLLPVCELILGYRYWVLRTLLDRQFPGAGAGQRSLYRFLDLPVHGRTD